MPELKFEQVLNQLKKQDYQPIYFFQGEEAYFIDLLVKEIEDNALPEEQKSFNQTIIYGKDIESDVGKIIDNAMRLPMMADRQVLIIKEAQHIKGWDNLIPYLENPTKSTILVFAHKNKKIDGRSSFGKLIKNLGVLFTSNSLNENKVDKVISQFIQAKGMTISPEALQLLVEYLGTDLGKIANEVDKLSLVANEKNITPQTIEEHIGISKDYNVFELQKAILYQDETKVFRILNYFTQNPKAGNIVYVITILYSMVAKLFTMAQLGPVPDNELARMIGVSPYFLHDYKQAFRRLSPDDIQKQIKILLEFDGKSKGIGSVSTNENELLKEMCFKLLHVNEI